MLPQISPLAIQVQVTNSVFVKLVQHLKFTYIQVYIFKKKNLILSPIWLFANSRPPASSPHQTNQRGWRLTCFLWNTWMQSTFQTAATSQGGVTHSEEIAIYPLPHSRAHRRPWLASIALISKRKINVIPSTIRIQTRSVLIIEWMLFLLCHSQENISSRKSLSMNLLIFILNFYSMNFPHLWVYYLI